MNCIKCRAELPEGAVFCPLCGKRQEAAPRKHRKRANGTGNISKLSGNRSKPWQAKKNGVHIGTFATRAEAQRALERLTDVNVTEKFNMTFAQVYDAIQPEMERKVSDKHIKGLKSAYNACPELHAQVFRILRRSDFQGVIIRLEQEGKSKSTCEKMRQLFSKMSKWALSEGIVQSNHAQYLDTVAKQKSVKRPLLQAEIDAIKASKNRGVPIVLILLGAGCRPNELFKVPLVNCHEDYFIGGSKTEAGENRIIMISSVGLQAYQELRAKAIRGKCARLIDAFEGNRDQHNFSKREFRDLMEETGITGVTMYNLRHTMITNAVRSGVDQRALQQMVGHAGAEITKNYTHLSADDLRKEINKIEEKTAVGYKLDTRSEVRIQVLEKSS